MEEESTIYQSFGEILRAYRKRKHITQKQLAQLLGTHANTISSWELGTYLPQTRGLVLEIAQHLGLNDQEARQLLEASLTALSSYWHLPSPRNPFFTGREDILSTLHTYLSTNQASYVLHGLGGIGKTQIAVEYAYRHAQEYTAILWIAAETPESIASSFLAIALVLGLPERQVTDQNRAASTVQRWLSTHRQWLLIWDNVESLDLLSSYLPPDLQGVMLFTTRRQTLGTLAQGMELQPMRGAEGTLFLLRRARLLDPTAQMDQLKLLARSNLFEYTAAQELVAAMDGLPLALDQVGAYVQETPCSLANYLKLYWARGAELLKWRGEMVIDHPASVVTTWSISFEKVEQTNATAVALLRVCAFLHPDAIPEELFGEGTALLGAESRQVAADTFLWHEAIKAASAYSLLKRNLEERTLSIHRLVQAVLRERMSEQERELWQWRAIHMLNACFPEVTPDTRRQCERLLPHVLACAAVVPAQARGQDLAEVLRKAADSLGEHGQNEPTSARKAADSLGEHGQNEPTSAEIFVHYEHSQNQPIAPAMFVPTPASHGPTTKPAVQPGLPPLAEQLPNVSSRPMQGVSWPSTTFWGPNPNQKINVSQSSTRAPLSPQPRSHLPLGKNWSRWKQTRWMVGYTMLALIWWIPCFIGTSSSEMPIPLLLYLVFLCVFPLPASVLFAGAIWGRRRGTLVTIFYTGIVALAVILQLSIWGSGSTGIEMVVFGSWIWPVAALVTGWLYQRRLFRGFAKAYATMLLGVGIMMAGMVFLIIVAGGGDVIVDVIILCCVPFVSSLLALPLAAIEVIIQRNLERAKGLNMHKAAMI